MIPATDPCNPFARLDCTDRAELTGGTVEQRGELLVADLADGSRLTLDRDLTGAAVLHIVSPAARAVVALSPELAVRIGSHLAALGAASLEPAPEDAA